VVAKQANELKMDAAKRWPKEPVNPNPPVKVANELILHENQNLVQENYMEHSAKRS
jgi:hypothetical protein